MISEKPVICSCGRLEALIVGEFSLYYFIQLFIIFYWLTNKIALYLNRLLR